MKEFNCMKLIDKIIGPINSIGDSSVDRERYENLKELCELHDRITFRISNEAKNCSDEATRVKSAKFAREFLADLRDSLSEYEEQEVPE